MGCAGLPYFIQGEISGNLNISGAIPPPACSSGRGGRGGWWPGCAGVRGGSPHRWATPLLGRGSRRGRRAWGVSLCAVVLAASAPSFPSVRAAPGSRLERQG